MTSLTRESALAIARERIDQLAQDCGDQFEILIESTKEVDQGWVIFFNTVEFVRTGNPSSELAGNGPIFVTREGKVFELPSSLSWEESLKFI